MATAYTDITAYQASEMGVSVHHAELIRARAITIAERKGYKNPAQALTEAIKSVSADLNEIADGKTDRAINIRAKATEAAMSR